MSLRSRLLMIFGGIVILTVVLVSYAVSTGARKAFQRIDEQRTRALIGQFQLEFKFQREAVALRTAAIARSQQLRSMALVLSAPAGDAAAYLSLAPTLATEQQLDYVEILAADGTIISSAQWPARFGLRETWLAEVSDWDTEPPFLRYQEVPQGNELALLSVRQVRVADRSFYAVAGRRMDSNFLHGLVLPEGTRVLLWQPGSKSTELQDAEGGVTMPSDLRPLLQEAQTGRSEITRRVRLNEGADGIFIAHAIPLVDRSSTQPLAVLVVASSRRELIGLQRRIQEIGLLAALTGILLSLLASRWWAARISRPIEELSIAAQDVAAGDWERKVSNPSLMQNDEVSRLITSFNQMTNELLGQRDRALQAERVAAWRELARRLAHELKNPLFPLQITIENLVNARRQNAPEFDEIFIESTTTLLAELSNLKKIIARFSDFSKMPAPQLQSVKVNRVLEELVKLFAPQLAAAAKPIRLQAELTPTEHAEISGDPDLLRRAFENLVLNAIDAMPAGGTLRIATSASAEILTVEVSDTGAGLTQEEASRLFTPYYTTKQHGTGLGLAIVQSVVSDHGARISVTSRPGEGTTFRIEFQRKAATPPTPGAFAGRV